MKGFSEEFKGRTFIFRVGELTVDYGTKWTHACVFHVRDRPVVELILNFVARILRSLFPVTDGEFIGMHSEPLTMASYNVGRKLAHNLGFTVSHKRMKDNGSYLIREIKGPDGEWMMTKLRDLVQNAPHKKHGSKQFVDDGADAHAAHGGRKGGNRIDNKQGAALGAAMLEHLKAGDLKIISVNPPEYSDPAKMKALNDSVASGNAKVKKIVTSQIAEDGQDRTKSVSFDFEGCDIPHLAIVYSVHE